MADGSDEGHAVKELVQMLFHPREDVRTSAAQIVSGLAADASGRDALYSTGVAGKLARLLGDEPAVARHAADALVNLSDEGRFLHQMLDIKIVRMVMESMRSPRCAHRRAGVMLLSNLCLTPEGCIQLLQRDEDDGRLMGLYLRQLLHWMLKGPPASAAAPGGTGGAPGGGASDESGDALEHAGLVLQNVTTLSEARRLLLDRERRIVPDLLQQLRSPSVLRRRGASGTLKNLCFEQDQLDALADPSLGFIESATRPLAGPEPRSAEEREDMPASWLELGPAKAREPDPVTRRNLLEVLAMLASSRAAREQMRATRVYEIVRDLHVWLEGHSKEETAEPAAARARRQAREQAYLEARGVGEQGAGASHAGASRAGAATGASASAASAGKAGGEETREPTEAAEAATGAGAGAEAGDAAEGDGGEGASHGGDSKTGSATAAGGIREGGFVGGVTSAGHDDDDDEEENPLSADDLRSVAAVNTLADFLHRDESGPAAIAGGGGEEGAGSTRASAPSGGSGSGDGAGEATGGGGDARSAS